MTDKLPQFVEDWIAQTTVTMQLNPKYSGVLEEDLRDFLVKFVLCEREPVGNASSDPESDAIVMTAAAMRIPSDKITPLHIPATEVPK